MKEEAAEVAEAGKGFWEKAKEFVAQKPDETHPAPEGKEAPGKADDGTKTA
ncbi:MAG: hypothetical protein IPH12_12295 [Saprospirales bacterium]|nr:hypothetical protein [Saprospirales bacterium]